MESNCLHKRLAAMKCGQRALTLVSLAFGLLATGSLALAVATDYWLYTSEPHEIQDLVIEDDLNDSYMPLYPNDSYIMETMDDEVMGGDYPSYSIEVHSGLWRMCFVMADIPDVSPVCAVVSYSDERITGVDTTWSILRAMRKKASPVFVISLLLQLLAFTLSTVGNAKRDFKTIHGAVTYIFSALILAVGVILYISAVNDEVSHRKKPTSSDEPEFMYEYGWAFFCAGGSFICSMMASVSNISLYLKRYPRLEDMVIIIPGLHSSNKSNYDFSKVSSEDEPDVTMGSQNPTIIL